MLFGAKNIIITISKKKSKCLRYISNILLVGWFVEKSFLISRQSGLLSLETQTTSDLSFLILYSTNGRLWVEEELFSNTKKIFAMRDIKEVLLHSATSATQSSFYFYSFPILQK